MQARSPANLVATLSTQRLLTRRPFGLEMLRDWPGSLSKKYSLVFSRHHLHGSMEKQQPSHEPEWPNGHSGSDSHCAGMISKAHPILSAAQPYYIITKKISSSTLEAGGWTKAMSPSHGCDSLKDTGRRWNKTIQGHVKLFTMADSPQRKRDTFGAPPKHCNKLHHVHTHKQSR